MRLLALIFYSSFFAYAYPLLRHHILEALAAVNGIHGVPPERPLRLVRQNSLLKCPPVMTAPAIRQLLLSTHLRVPILYRLLPVQHQPQQRAQQLLHLRRRRRVHNPILDVLRAVVREFSGEDVVEARAEHDDELPARTCQHTIHSTRLRDQARHERAGGRVAQLTGIEASSASTSSWGGDGALFGRGGETTGGGATSLVAFFALRKMGASFWISFSEWTDRPLLSESSAMVQAGGVGCCCSGRCGWWKGKGVEVEVEVVGFKRKGCGLDRQRQSIFDRAKIGDNEAG